jgi:aspartate kinase
MALIVQKFGGTSVGSLERIRQVAAKIMQARAQGHNVVAVVSAMSGETDRLINLAKTIHEQPEPREYAVLVATGEQVSIALLTMVLIAAGCPARSYTGIQAQIRTDQHYQKARILAIEPHVLQKDLLAGYVPVVAGFQGVTENGDITTLGRGGSDTTAVALAAALQADECQIFTDVDGVYTADPRIVPTAQRLAKITFPEMLELASLGAKVVQQRAVEFAGKYQVPLRVLSTFEEGSGTFISFAERGLEQPGVTGITYNRNEAKITLRIPQRAEAIAHILMVLADAQIDIDMLVQQEVMPDIMEAAFTIARDDFTKALALLDSISAALKITQLTTHRKVAKISLVGIGLRSHPATISTLFKTLGTQNIAVQLTSMAEIKISILIEEQDVERCMCALHVAFGLEHVAVGVLQPSY